MNYAATFLDHFHEVHDTGDGQTRPVIVFRRLGTSMAFNDSLWDRYRIGEESKTNDSATSAPARRNPFWKAPPGASAQEAATKIEALNPRGLISLVCNVSVNSWSNKLARRTQRDVEELYKELKAGGRPSTSYSRPRARRLPIPHFCRTLTTNPSRPRFHCRPTPDHGWSP